MRRRLKPRPGSSASSCRTTIRVQSVVSCVAWTSAVLSAENKRQLWVPEGFAHGFVVTSESAEFLYKTTDYWYPEHERSLAWNDPEVGIDWPVEGQPMVAAKDAAGKRLPDADVFA